MKKRKIYQLFSEKYNLPYKYIAFVTDRIYLYKVNIKLEQTQINDIENSILCDRAKEEFEILRLQYSSVFYGM